MANRLSTLSASTPPGQTAPARVDARGKSGFGNALRQVEREAPAAKAVVHLTNQQQPTGKVPTRWSSAISPQLGSPGLVTSNATPTASAADESTSVTNFKSDLSKPNAASPGDTSAGIADESIAVLSGAGDVEKFVLPAPTGSLVLGIGPAIATSKAKALSASEQSGSPRDRVQRKPIDAQAGADPLATTAPATPAQLTTTPHSDVVPRADLPNPTLNLPFAKTDVPVSTMQAELVSTVLPGQQADPVASGKTAAKDGSAPPTRPGLFALEADMTLVGPSGVDDRVIVPVSGGAVSPAVNLGTPSADATLTAAATPGRKGVAAMGVEADATTSTSLAPQTDLSAASNDVSRTPSNPTGPVALQAAASGHGAVSIANQILPSVIALAQGHVSNDRISISMSPDMLGHVSITVDRAADGTTSIQISSERLATMELLRSDQADLLRALHQAGISQDSHSLSFSWQGGHGGMQGWGGQGEPQGERRPAAAQFYAEETASAPAFNGSTSHGGIDVTA